MKIQLREFSQSLIAAELIYKIIQACMRLQEVVQKWMVIVKKTLHKTVDIFIFKLVHPEVLLQQTEVLQISFIIIVSR